MASRVRVPVASLAEDQGTVVSLTSDEAAVFRRGGDVYAYRNACPHRGGPVGEGLVVDGVVTCPWHGNRFDIATGTCLSDPTLPPLTRIRWHRDGDELVVGV